jgi:hypothetical protein
VNSELITFITCREYGRYSILRFHFIEVLKYAVMRRVIECISLQIQVSCVVSLFLGSKVASRVGSFVKLLTKELHM